MTPYCLFLARHGQKAPVDRLLERLKRLNPLGWRIHFPLGGAIDPFLTPEQDAPVLVIQVFFEDLIALEEALAGPMALTAELGIDALGYWSWQAMVARNCTAPGAVFQAAGVQCGYLVAYVGRARDDAAWLDHYVSHHIPLLQRLPGLRTLEFYTRVEVACTVPLAQEMALQRNLTVFDSAQDLTIAMNSDVRIALREDYLAFPPFEGKAPHVATRMNTYGFS